MKSKLFWAFALVIVILSGCQFDTGLLPPEPSVEVIYTLCVPTETDWWYQLIFIEISGGRLEIQINKTWLVDKNCIVDTNDETIIIGTSQEIKEVTSYDLKLKLDASFVLSYSFVLPYSDAAEYDITVRPKNNYVLVSIETVRK